MDFNVGSKFPRPQFLHEGWTQKQLGTLRQVGLSDSIPSKSTFNSSHGKPACDTFNPDLSARIDGLVDVKWQAIVGEEECLQPHHLEQVVEFLRTLHEGASSIEASYVQNLIEDHLCTLS